MNTYKALARFAQGKLKQEVSIGRHHLLADVVTEEGGEDAAPSPHDFLAAALASCTSMTLKMYARRKAWPLEDVVVEVTLSKLEGGVLFETQVDLVGALDETQKKRLFQIAEHCPVHKTLKGQIEIQTSLKP